MEQIADRLVEKIHSLTPEQLAEVERFVKSLDEWQADRELNQMFLRASEPAFGAVWSNPEDDAYDAI